MIINPTLLKRVILLCIGTAVLTVPVVSAGELTLIAGGGSGHAIVVPDEPDPRDRVGQAATVLQTRLREATGVELPVVKESELTPDSPAIYLGLTRKAAAADLPLDQVQGWTFLKRVVGHDLFLVGHDADAGTTDKAVREYLGTLKAVTSFLEDEVGVRFLLPGQEHGTYVPTLDALVIPDDLDLLKPPHFLYVTGRGSMDPVYDVANQYWKNQILWSYGGHSYYDAVPTKTYGESNPEYFVVSKGKRDPSQNHLCISNPDVQELLMKEMERRLDMGFQWVELAQTDGYRACECTDCAAIHAEPSERLWIVHRKLAEQMKTRRPGKKIMIIAYRPTDVPPKTFTDFPDNVVIQMSRYAPKHFEQWKPFNVPITIYAYNWGVYHAMGFGPKCTPEGVSEQVQRFVEAGVQGLYLCGAHENPGLEGPNFWIYGQMMGDPSLDYLDLLDEFYAAAYGKAAEPMRHFFGGYHRKQGIRTKRLHGRFYSTSMYDQLELRNALGRPNYHVERRVPGLRRAEPSYCQFFRPEILRAMEENLEKARKLAENPHVKARLRLVELEFDYVKSLARVFHFHRVYELEPNARTLSMLLDEIDRRNALIDGWFDDQGRVKLSDGWPRLFGGRPREYVRAGGRMNATHPVLLWDTQAMRKGTLVELEKAAARNRTAQEQKKATDPTVNPMAE